MVVIVGWRRPPVMSPAEAEHEIALLQKDSKITCCLKTPFAAEVKEVLKEESKASSGKIRQETCGHRCGFAFVTA